VREKTLFQASHASISSQPQPGKPVLQTIATLLSRERPGRECRAYHLVQPITLHCSPAGRERDWRSQTQCWLLIVGLVLLMLLERC